MSKFKENWRKTQKEVKEMRREFLKNKEYNCFIVSYALAPFFWLLALAFCLYYSRNKKV